MSARLLSAVAAVVGAVMLSGCAGAEATADDALAIYATTGYLADAARQIAPDADVQTMVGPGGDPHTYQPSTRDIQSMQEADVVLWNGLHLEAQMLTQLESLGDRQLEAAGQLPEDLLLSWPDTDDEGNPLHDPHVWNSPTAWSLVIGYVAEKLAEVDPDNAAEYQANAVDHQQQIAAAAAETEQLLATVPEPRILITGHDAFNYFGDTYDLDVYATDFVSTEAILSAGKLSELAGLIAKHKVPVIFHDNQANPQAINSLREAVQARGWDVKISTEQLYADSLGTDPGVDTYLGVFTHNSHAIADALGSTDQ